MTTIYIYVLLDPDTEQVGYVGKTPSPDKRLYQHCQDTSQTRKAKWIQSLIAEGKKPKMVIIDQCGENEWLDLERKWIKHYRDISPILTNGSLNGGSVSKGLPTKSRIVQFNVTEKYFQWLNEQARKRDISLSLLIRQALKAHIPDQPQEGE